MKRICIITVAAVLAIAAAGFFDGDAQAASWTDGPSLASWTD